MPKDVFQKVKSISVR